MNTQSNIWRKLKNKKYRDAFTASQLKRGIPFQISALRGKLNWSQGGLAKASGLTQGVISRAENPNYGNLTFNTALRIAAGFDVAFVGWFVPFSKLTEWFENMSEESMQIASFKEEDSIEQEQKLPAIAREATAGVITNLARIEKVKKEIPSATDLASDGRNYGKEKLGLAQTQL